MLIPPLATAGQEERKTALAAGGERRACCCCFAGLGCWLGVPRQTHTRFCLWPAVRLSLAPPSGILALPGRFRWPRRLDSRLPCVFFLLPGPVGHSTHNNNHSAEEREWSATTPREDDEEGQRARQRARRPPRARRSGPTGRERHHPLAWCLPRQTVRVEPVIPVWSSHLATIIHARSDRPGVPGGPPGLLLGRAMILPQVHLQQPCYDFCFL